MKELNIDTRFETAALGTILIVVSFVMYAITSEEGLVFILGLVK